MFNSAQGGYQRFLSRTGCPVTLALIAVNVVTFFVFASGGAALASLLFQSPGSFHTIWTLVTWPLLGAGHPLNVVFACLWAFWVCGSLERSWGSRDFGLFFVAVSAITALAVWVGSLALQRSGMLFGLWEGVAAPTIAWCAINRRETVNLYGVLPVPVPAIAALTLVILWYQVGPPLLGLFALVGCAAAYFYATQGRYAFRGYAASPVLGRRRPKLRVENYEREAGRVGPGLSPIKRYRAWQERRKLERLWKRSMGDGDERDRGSR